ncbi:MFS transporter [Psychromarinibacter sp. C21-152]|uniref:MFS transporter n=1 Tax=Psychromarinibacter sediminicola TaxID=3033385 RepID=A0AAE3T6L6_9RHOB|nr:MFS transporter [Psychromarinibacter sediminicola]MDF0599392.1 MFS transporter [Psychromarinibacter sediminicola]
MDILRDPRAIALLLAASLTIMSNATISPSLPGIEAAFADTPNAGLLTRLLVTAPALLIAIAAPFAGIAADRFGRKRQLLAGVALFAVAGSAGLWLGDLYAILASRLILGLAVAAVMTSQAALLGDIFNPEQRGRFMGYQMAAVNFGGFLFIALAGWLAGIWALLPFALYAVALLYLPFLSRTLPDSRGGAAPSGGAMPEGDGSQGWFLILAFVIFLSGLTFILFYVMPTQIPYFLADTGHADPSTSGAVMACVVLAAGTVSLFFGWIRRRLGRGGTPATGFAVMGAGFWVLHSATTVPLFFGAALLVGAGLGLAIPNFIAIALDVAPAHRRGTVSGAITTSIFLGQFISPLVSQPLIDSFGYRVTFEAAAIALAVIVPFVALGLRRPRGGYAEDPA